MQTISSVNASASPARTPAAHRRLLIDAPMRMFHWLFALAFVGAYITADGERWRLLHVTLGYTMAGLLVFRLLYGIFGPRQARLGMMWRKLAAVPVWVKSIGSSPSLAAINWRQGQNLLMALAVVALLLMVIPVSLSGYAIFNDLGGEWLEDVHEFFGEAFLFVVLAHLALIAALSLLRGKNQALPMLTGRVEGPGPDVVKKNRIWLAALLLLAVLGYLSWEWSRSPNGLVPTQAWSSSSRAQHDD